MVVAEKLDIKILAKKLDFLILTGKLDFTFLAEKLDFLFGGKTQFCGFGGKTEHPAITILNNVVSKFMLPISNKNSNFHCKDCLVSKSHKTPFSQTSLTSSHLLELVFSDVWTSPMYSVDGYKYYVIFVDHFTHYVWFYPLRNKSDVCHIFIRWKAVVENKFNHKLKTFYSDNGGEYLALRDDLALSGFSIERTYMGSHSARPKV